METKTQPETRKPGTTSMLVGLLVSGLALVLMFICLITGEQIMFTVVILFMGLGALVFGFLVRVLNALER